jgi:hypothetical protein
MQVSYCVLSTLSRSRRSTLFHNPNAGESCGLGGTRCRCGTGGSLKARQERGEIS